MAAPKKDAKEKKTDRIAIQCSQADYERHGKGNAELGKKALTEQFLELRDKQIK